MTEHDLVSRATIAYRNAGYAAFPWVRVPPRELDIVIVDAMQCTVLVIEAKLRDWRRAINQARGNAFWADYTAILVPSSAVLRVDLGILGALGIGLMQLSDASETQPISVVVQAARSSDTIRTLRSHLYTKLARRGLDDGAGSVSSELD